MKGEKHEKIKFEPFKAHRKMGTGRKRAYGRSHREKIQCRKTERLAHDEQIRCRKRQHHGILSESGGTEQIHRQHNIF